MKFLTLLGLAIPALVAAKDLSTEVVTGTSTFYGGNLNGGNCGFSTYTLPSGIYGTAFSGSNWNAAANCGSCIQVTGPTGKTIKAMIVDQCPECDKGHLDLFQNAFTAVGGTDGLVKTSFKWVTCDITSPLILRNKEGTSQWWFSMQVINHNEPIKSLQVSTDGGKTWKATTRRDYNFFENSSGFGTSTVDVKVTSSTGKTITVKNVSVAAQVQTKAASNF
ncbi:RlpA-like double-psi beta-barrel-protein domain-containing protein-containing protein [Thelonectria olida]|uniref:RlpA-like double-psi beta-barrel-protein domain-containing protein-containing protein n=1 Tax=Thelonectria olida TaxID=1576542 RepID=A0A9P9APJ2_9HYPO|nr:RlpA-like double-psi beta-barrel-protein domain-containing protein-containing protein [Thelonectria olida]